MHANIHLLLMFTSVCSYLSSSFLRYLINIYTKVILRSLLSFACSFQVFKRITEWLQYQKVDRFQTAFQLTMLLMYPTAKALRTHPCPWRSHLNSSAICMMAIGIMTRSAALMKLASEQRPIVLVVLVNCVTVTEIDILVAFGGPIFSFPPCKILDLSGDILQLCVSEATALGAGFLHDAASSDRSCLESSSWLLSILTIGYEASTFRPQIYTGPNFAKNKKKKIITWHISGHGKSCQQKLSKVHEFFQNL